MDGRTQQAVSSQLSTIGRPPILDSLTKEDMDQLTQNIMGGMFPHVAAQAMGITNRTFWRYMEVGKAAHEKISDNKRLDSDYERKCFEFWRVVDMAAAVARGECEQVVKGKDPEKWLRYGPGRDRGPENPGWTETVRIEKRTNVEISLSEDTAALLGEIVQTFNEGPEARVIDAPEARNAEFSRGSTALTPLSASGAGEPELDEQWAECHEFEAENE